MAKASAAAGAAAGGKKKGVKEFTGRQKAAVFLVSIGSEISAEIFKYLREDEIETLTFEIARLETIEPDQKDAVLMEFQELMMANEFITTGGIDYARELLEKSLEVRRLSISSTALLPASRSGPSTLYAALILRIFSTLSSRNIPRLSP
jgi:flagellar motor switch protein FliG